MIGHTVDTLLSITECETALAEGRQLKAEKIAESELLIFGIWGEECPLCGKPRTKKRAKRDCNCLHAQIEANT